MPKGLLGSLLSLDTEEKILNGSALMTVISVFLPWMGGEWRSGEAAQHSGFSFYTSFIGIAVFSLSLFVLLITILPLLGGPVLVRKINKHSIRLFVAVQSTVLVLAALTVLTNVSLEFSRMEIRFGIMLALVSSMVASLYAFLGYQEERKRQIRQLFHQPDPKVQDDLFGPDELPPSL